MQKLPVAETFYSLQGEGPSVGKPAFFIRLVGCPVKCKWCDTPQGMQGGENLTVEEILKRIPEGTQRVVITGGEPLLYQDKQAFGVLLDQLQGFYIEVETSGIVVPKTSVFVYVDQWNVSPKLLNAEAKFPPGQFLHALEAWTHLMKVYLKFVISYGRELEDAAEAIVFAKRLSIPNDRVFFMPECSNYKELMQGLEGTTKEALRYGVGLTPRLHLLAGIK